MLGHLPSRVSFITRCSVVSSSVAFSTSSRVIAFGIALVIMKLTYSEYDIHQPVWILWWTFGFLMWDAATCNQLDCSDQVCRRL